MRSIRDLWDQGGWLVARPPGFDPAALDQLAGRLAQNGEGGAVFPTSGSGGMAKFVELPRQALDTSARAVNDFFGLTSQDRSLLALPQFHVGGFMIGWRALAAGGTFEVLDSRWSAKRFVEHLRRLEISVTSLVPTQLVDLVEARLRAPDELRLVVVGGGALDRELAAQALQLGWPVAASFGMTEAASQIASGRPGGAASESGLEVLPHWRLDTDPLGRLRLEGGALFDGYWNLDAGQWHFTRRPNGSWTTSDRVRIANGRLTPIGRVDRIVKILGEQVDLEAMEKLLRREAGSQRGGHVALVDLPDTRCGVRLVLAGELPSGELEKIRERFNQIVRPFERLAGVLELEELPRSALGKLRRTKLREVLMRAESGLD